MDVVVKGMEMPESCPCELLGTGYDLYCSFARGIPARVKEYYECCQNNKRPSWCPLVPVPPHGRLIDADALEKAIYEWMPKAQETWMESEIPPIEILAESVLLTIDEQPTVEVLPSAEKTGK